MGTATLDKKIIETSFKDIINSLSDKEKTVISERVWLNWDRKTLQFIGASFSPSITRERVRQIEDSWIKKIGRIIKSSNLYDIQNKARDIIKLHWDLISKDKLINNLIKELNIDPSINANILETIVQADVEISKSKPKLGTKTYFYFPSINKSLIEQIHKEWIKILKKKKDVMRKIDLYEQIKHNIWNNSLSNVLIDNIMDVFDDVVDWEENLIWLTKWKILNPKTLKDKAIYVMKKQKTPMHFVDISNNITKYLWDNVKVNTIHNELIRNNEFVLIWRWLYALKEWGFKPGTVIDVIIDVLKKNKEPMSTEDIIKNVLKVRNVKKTTIYMNLQNKDIIKRVGRNYYDIK